MKKILCLLLALAITLSICGCSLKAETLDLNETVTIGDYEVTITGTEFTYGWDPNTLVSFSNSKDGLIHFIIYYTVKNVGNSQITIPDGLFKVIYDDEYEFTAGESAYYYSYDVDSYVANGNVLPPLSKEIKCKKCIDVSEQIKDDTEKPLKLEFKLKGKKYIIDLRAQNQK